MQISWDTFLKCITEIQELSDQINDIWNIVKTDGEEFNTYLTKKQFLTRNPLEDNLIITIEYHVVFSVSYAVPLLCMNAWRNNGTILLMEELWNYLNFTEGEHVYNTLTQMDHPILMRPYLTLHPCKTAELLENMFSNSRNPVVSYLSAVGPVVNLTIDNEYSKLT